MTGGALLIDVTASLGLEIRIVSALILISAGLAKIQRTKRFKDTLSEYRIMPAAMVGPVAALLPPAEIGLGIALLAPAGNAISALLAAGLFLAFAMAIAINLSRGRKSIDCGCSLTSHDQPIRPAMVFRNLGLTAMLIAAAFAPPVHSLANGAIAAIAGGLLFAAYLVWNQIFASDALASRSR